MSTIVITSLADMAKVLIDKFAALEMLGRYIEGIKAVHISDSLLIDIEDTIFGEYDDISVKYVNKRLVIKFVGRGFQVPIKFSTREFYRNNVEYKAVNIQETQKMLINDKLETVHNLTFIVSPSAKLHIYYDYNNAELARTQAHAFMVVKKIWHIVINNITILNMRVFNERYEHETHYIMSDECSFKLYNRDTGKLTDSEYLYNFEIKPKQLSATRYRYENLIITTDKEIIYFYKYDDTVVGIDLHGNHYILDMRQENSGMRTKAALVY